MGMDEDLQRYGQMPPGLLSPRGIDPNGDEALAMQIARDQGVPMNVARYMLSAPSREDGGRTYGGWPYPSRDQGMETPGQSWRGPPAAQPIGDIVPFKPAILPGIQGGPGGTEIDMGGGVGMHMAPPLISPGQYNSMPDTEPSLRYLLRHGAANEANAGRPANEALMQHMMRLYGLA